MALNSEWRPRVEQWQNALKSLFYQKVGVVAIEAAFTFDQLTPEQAHELEYTPISPGTKWGADWEYAWFRGRIVLPAVTEGQMIMLQAGEQTPQWSNAEPYGEWRYIINGQEAGSRDWAHIELRLTEKASVGAVYNVLAEAFGGPTRVGAGGGPALGGPTRVGTGAGPALPAVKTRPTAPAMHRTMPDITFGIWHEEVFQLWMDVQTLLELRDQLDPASLRVDQVDAALRDFTLIADPELPWEEFMPTVSAARKVLRPLLECRNGTTAPTLFCVGHSHLDVAYQWPFAETERKVARTFSNQLQMIEDYPEYRYLQSMPVLYETAKRLYPTIYQRVKAAVKHGQWLPEGGMWTEADTNLTGGESLIRQFIYGRQFFCEEFGVESVLAWLPDIFGYSGALPQIMAGCGMKYFASAKIYALYNGGDSFPYTSFWWEGIDGTRILSHCPGSYGSLTNPGSIAHIWTNRPQKEGLHSRLVAFGHSDGGGGADRTHLEFLRREADLEGLPRTRHATPSEFFSDLDTISSQLPTYVGEIYFAVHRGTYTTQAQLKLGNRRCEFALREAEIWASAACCVKGVKYPQARLASAWKKTLFNQFHDILPGSCIQRAAEEAVALYAESLSETKSVLGEALHSLCTAKPCAYTAFNSLSWSRNVLLEIPADAEIRQPEQDIGGIRHAEVNLAPMGWTPVSHQGPPTLDCAIATSRSLENDLLRVEFSDFGEITSCLDKENGRELSAGPMNAFRLFRDTPRVCDAWDIDSHYELQPVATETAATIEIVASGPLAAVLRIRRRLHNSEMEQEIWLRRNSRRLDFRTRIHWQEKHKLLKVCFPVSLHASEAMHEIQFGYLKRPTHRSRQHDRDRYEVCQQKWSAIPEENAGVALLNDCKYGISTFENSLNLTLLRATLAPDDHADQGSHEFTYSFYSWDGPFSSSRVTQEAYDLNTPVQLCQGYSSTGTRSLFQINATNIIIETLKLAEDGSGDLILRLYETLRASTNCRLDNSLPISRVFETDMLETNRTELGASSNGVELRFRPFEIKTLRLKRS